MDVVEADAKDWTRDPFVPVEENGYIFGRGSEDNKFDVSMMVAAMAQLKKDGFKPNRSIILLLSGDEETQMLTTRALAAKYKNAEFALNGDGGGGTIAEDGKPQYYGLQAGEKTYADFTLEVTNPGGHSSRPSPVNAIVQLSNALAKVGAYKFAAQQNELTKIGMPIVADQVGGNMGAALKAFAANPEDADAITKIRADPEYVGQIGTTCVPTLVKGGHAENALPQRATANINCRIFPGVPVETRARRAGAGDRRPRGQGEPRSRRQRQRRLAAAPRRHGGGDQGRPRPRARPADHPVDERRAPPTATIFASPGCRATASPGCSRKRATALRTASTSASPSTRSPPRWRIGTACCAICRNSRSSPPRRRGR